MYPDTIHINQKQLVLRVYEKVRQGIVMKFPKNFFSEANGLLNANICLQYAINRDLIFKNIQELYEYFSDRLQAVAFLKECKLYAPCCEFYEYPIDYLHHSLPDAERNSLYYHFGRFLTNLEETKEKLQNSNEILKEPEKEDKKEDLDAEIKEENEENMMWFMNNHPFKLESIDPYLPEELHSETTALGYLQLLPGVHKTDGFFIAKFRRK